MTEAQHNLRNSWIKHGNDSDFSIYNIPFGIAKYKDHTIRVVTRIDDQVVNLYALFKDGYFAGISRSLEGLFDQTTLNLFIDAGKKITSGVRQRIQQLLDENDTEIANKDEFVSRYMIPYDEVEMMLPVKINNYTDFYSSLEHA
ncbi:MAG: fumarylacetoacetase, partial [Omnitrophica WOR_2 bacterium]